MVRWCAGVGDGGGDVWRCGLPHLGLRLHTGLPYSGSTVLPVRAGCLQKDRSRRIAIGAEAVVAILDSGDRRSGERWSRVVGSRACNVPHQRPPYTDSLCLLESLLAVERT